MTAIRHRTGWFSTTGTAPTADKSLITQARNEGLAPGQPLGALFGPQASTKAKEFLKKLAPRARAALENAARDEKIAGKS